MKKEIFDPIGVILQIIIFQSSQYFSLGVILVMMNALFGAGVFSSHMDQYFSYRSFSIFTRSGLATILSWLLLPIFGFLFISFCHNFFKILKNKNFRIPSLYFFIKKSKKCLDFSLTFQIIHFVFCIFYKKGIPIRWEWWVCMTVNTIVTTFASQFFCHQRELREIPLNSSMPIRLKD